MYITLRFSVIINIYKRWKLFFTMTYVRIFRCCNFTGSLFSLKIKRVYHEKLCLSKFSTRTLYNMNTAYIQHTEGEERVHVTVNFSELNISKVLNFNRNILEKLVDFVKKIDNRIADLYTKKMKKKDTYTLVDLPQSFLYLNNTQISDNLMFKDLFQNDFNGDLKLKLLDKDYNVLLNAPIISSMSLLKNLQVGCVVTPQDWKTEFTNLEQSEFTWYRSKHQMKEKSWEKCGDGPCYKIKEDDDGYYLKVSCIPKLNEKVGPIFEVCSETTVEKSDNFTVIQRRQQYTKEKTKPNEFRIVSYNILADLYVNTKEAKSQIFTFCDPQYLVYHYRKNLINTEIQGYSADILCMQEVERKFYNSNFLLFNEWGYDGLYHEKEGAREGCALLYNRNKFNLLSANQYTFTKELLNNPILSDIKSKIETNSKLVERLNNVASQIQVVVLECISDNVLVIGNVHFYFHPDADHIRLLQGVISLKILLNEVAEIKKMEPTKKISVVLCGDFNSTPECGFHQLLSEGSVESSHIGWRSKEEEAIEGVSCSHSLKMRSCYDHLMFTNYIPNFKACIDYIYFQSDHLELKQSVPVPDEEILSEFSGIPSRFLPSDHVALIADLKFKDVSDE